MSAIPASSPHVIPAIPEQVFDHTWVLDFQARSHGMGPDSLLSLNLAPYQEGPGGSFGVIDMTNQREVRGSLWDIVNNVPSAAAAMQAVFAAVPDIEAYLASVNTPPESE